MSKIAAVVILYNPNDRCINLIESYYYSVDKLFIIDNSQDELSPNNSLRQLPKVLYLYDGRNKGIAESLNITCNLAIHEGYDWLLTMDQDSFFSKNSISNYIKCIEGLDSKELVAMTGVEFIEKKNADINCTYTEVSSLITSGSMINLASFQTIGSFDEDLFIDQVDFEYCYRSIIKGYKIIKFNNIFMDHLIGETSLHKSIKSFKSTARSLHSAKRLYYMTRNYLYVKSKYNQQFKPEIYKTKQDLLNRIKNNVLYRKDRIEVIKFILLGIIDFKRGKMGKI
jgi:rhamnosyltransferase